MPSYFGPALAGGLAGFQQGIDQGFNRRLAQETLHRMQMENALRQQEMASAGATGDVLAQVYGGPPMPPLAAPYPGTPSQPAQPPQQPFPAPAFQTVGQQAEPQKEIPQPSPVQQGVGPAGISPYKPMSQLVQPQPGGGGLLPPTDQLPRQQHLTFETLTKGLIHRGVTGPALMNALNKAAPMLKSEDQRQIQDLNQQLKVAQLTVQMQQVDSQIRDREERAKDRALSREDRQAAQQSADEMRREALRLREMLGSQSIDVRREGISSREDLARERLAAQRERDLEKQSGKHEKEMAPVVGVIDSIDDVLRQIKANPQVVGGLGMLSRGKEFVTSTISPGTETPASTFQSSIIDLQSKWRKLPTVAANRFAADYKKIDEVIKGLGAFTSATQASDSLTHLRDMLAAQARPPAAGGGAPAQTNAKGWKLMTDANGNQAYVSPDGKQFEEIRR